MKKIISCILVVSLIAGACNNNKTKEGVTVNSKDVKETVTMDPNEVQHAAQDMAKMKEELGKLTPLSQDQLKALVPDQLMGTAHSAIDVNAAAGATIANTRYKMNDSTDVSLTIIDCAGPGGAGIYSLQYLGMYNMQEDNEEEYTKTIDFNGGKAFESCKKTRPECTLTYFSGGRFLVILEGDHVEMNELKNTAKSLNIK
jgi:PBP1b-binding outer membrane lipoprotein LpoB